MTSLSIITVNLNNAPGLAITLRSIASQTFKNFELIIIDGGSSDESISVITQFRSTITTWISEKDNGIYHAQNKGISKAVGEYCLFLNSGDYLAGDDVLDKMFSANSDADIFYGDLFFMKKNSRPEYKGSPDHISKLHLLKDTLWHPVAFIRRRLFFDCGMYDEQFRITADYEFFVRTIIYYKVTTRHIPVAVSVFSLTGVSSDPASRKQIEKERKEIQNLYFNPILLFFFRLYAKLRN
jgi:glycosyltransferase involved in cell wall biosynthesis